MARFQLENYVDVQERINRFREEFPDGAIVTTLASLPDEFERVVFKADVYRRLDDPRPAAVGWASEVAGTPGANVTSWHENAETSAIGRALANLGYAKTREDRPSRQEMAKVERGPVPIRQPPAADPETGEILPDPPPVEGAHRRPMADGFRKSLVIDAGKRGLSDDDRHLVTRLRFDKQSWNDLDAPDGAALKAWLERHPADGWAVVLDFLRLIDEATTPDAVSAVGRRVNDAGLAGDVDLVECGRRKKAALSPSPAALPAMPAPAGRPGADRYTGD